MTAEALLDVLTASYRANVLIERVGDATEITTNNTLRDGTPVTVYLEPSDDQFVISDRGLVADHLDTFGVDLGRANIAESWNMIRASVGFPAAFGADDWELTAVTGAGTLAVAIQAVADSAIRGDALRVLARGYVPQTFAGRVTSILGRTLTIVPKAPIPGRHGGQRTVTCVAGVKRPRYIQALSGGASRVQSFDHALALWVGSDVEQSDRISLLQHHGRDWEPWQVAQLRDISRTITEEDIDALIAEIQRDETAVLPA